MRHPVTLEAVLTHYVHAMGVGRKIITRIKCWLREICVLPVKY